MAVMALFALIFGVLCGMFTDHSLLDFLNANSSYVLYALMFSVGISVGMHHGLWERLKQYHIKIMLIPLGTLIGTLIGGVLCSYVLKMDLNESLAVVSGLGWYSLSGITITSLANAQLGTIAFISNLMREIFSFLLIPLINKYFNRFACIASAGATSEDTTLPMLIKYTDKECVILAVFNGVVLSFLVPILINFFLG